ncbi:MAG: CotH kinase family protein [Bacteroidetes bacterium]|nr:CotH kinase family protein [Bacteroidota bacterium]
MKKIAFIIGFIFQFSLTEAQIVINEGSNKNYSAVIDEEGEYVDWIELYNPTASAIDLYNYSLTDTSLLPTQWTFPHFNLQPGAYEVIFCSGKNYFATPPFVPVINTGTFSPVNGWNTHNLTVPFYWDGSSNLLINVCSYSSTGYTVNSVFNQSATPFNSSLYTYQDGNAGACGFVYGTTAMQRPNVRINGMTIGTGNIQNGNTEYPAPYGNWYWGARNQFLILASELTAAGLSAGNFTTLAFDVVTADPAVYDYIEIGMNASSISTLSNKFVPNSGYNYHTNFKISNSGETISLYAPGNILQNSLNIQCGAIDVSKGRLPDAAANITSFQPSTPGATNNGSPALNGYTLAPGFTVSSGIYNTPFAVSILNPNGVGSSVYYTLNGSDPTTGSTLYTGNPIYIFQNTPLKAKAFMTGKIPSSISNASYLFGINHVTPILSVITDSLNLFGPNGNFDNPVNDWLKAAYVECFDSTPAHSLLFSQHTGMIQDGGAGGSRFQPQRSFKLELDHSVVGDGPVNYAMIPDRPNRNTYSKFYLRNGSNQYLELPYKDAAQVRMMAGETYNYYSAWRPMSVYINGQYWGLYELREKFDTEYFKEQDTATVSTVDILSQSYFYQNVLRSVSGNPVDTFINAYNAFKTLNTNSPLYWDSADHYFDMTHYNDYIIGQSWMGNTDWPQNNIKIYRSDKTNNRYRFCIIDQELAMNPNGWTNCTYDHIDYMLNQNPNNPYINVWLKSMQNTRFKTYFINRFADLMNTSYDTARLRGINTYMYNQTVAEMPNEFLRWGDANNIPAQMNDFYHNYLSLDSELVCRTTEVRNHIESNFNLVKQVDITLDVFPAGAGKIQISTVSPATYPWKGVYFDGVPVKITAIANPGYSFLHWGQNVQLADTLNPVFLDTCQNDLTFKAYFKALPNFIPSIEEFKNNFVLYPSPAFDKITLLNQNQAIMAEGFFEIVNMAGVKVLSGNLDMHQQNTVVPLSNISAGVYLFNIIDKKDGMKWQIRFVKM